jgi:hypothetical protein
MSEFDTKMVDALAAAEEGSEQKQKRIKDLGIWNNETTVAICSFEPRGTGKTTKINTYYLEQAIDVLNKMDCYTAYISIDDDRLLILRQSPNSEVGVVVCPVKDDDEEQEAEV